jgi:hypothetical protein
MSVEVGQPHDAEIVIKGIQIAPTASVWTLVLGVAAPVIPPASLTGPARTMGYQHHGTHYISSFRWSSARFLLQSEQGAWNHVRGA